MAHTLLREQVIQLRLQGYTYNQIKRELGIPKATLSNWLSKMPLSPERLEELEKNRKLGRDLAVEKFRETFRIKRLNRRKEVYSKQKEILPLSEKELFIAGLFLYWGEGDKDKLRVGISNTDPRIIKFAFYWMIECLRIPQEKIKVQLHLYKDMNIEDSIKFWSDVLNLPKEQFAKPYVKKSSREGLTYKSFGHGTCKIFVCSVELSEKVAMTIKAISDTYGARDEIFWYN